jgi:hypothetical protein
MAFSSNDPTRFGSAVFLIASSQHGRIVMNYIVSSGAVQRTNLPAVELQGALLPEQTGKLLQPTLENAGENARD